MEDYIFILINNEGVVLKYSEYYIHLFEYANSINLKNYIIKKVFKVN
jgi:hypothetical protein